MKDSEPILIGKYKSGDLIQSKFYNPITGEPIRDLILDKIRDGHGGIKYKSVIGETGWRAVDSEFDLLFRLGDIVKDEFENEWIIDRHCKIYDRNDNIIWAYVLKNKEYPNQQRVHEISSFLNNYKK